MKQNIKQKIKNIYQENINRKKKLVSLEKKINFSKIMRYRNPLLFAVVTFGKNAANIETKNIRTLVLWENGG